MVDSKKWRPGWKIGVITCSSLFLAIQLSLVGVIRQDSCDALRDMADHEYVRSINERSGQGQCVERVFVIHSRLSKLVCALGFSDVEALQYEQYWKDSSVGAPCVVPHLPDGRTVGISRRQSTKRALLVNGATVEVMVAGNGMMDWEVSVPEGSREALPFWERIHLELRTWAR